MSGLGMIGRSWKLFWSYRLRKERCDYYPSRLWIELTNNCNLHCEMCLNKLLPSSAKGYMDFPLFKKLIDEISGKVHDAYFHHRGESLLHPQIFEMISYAKNKGIYTRLHTNATLLDERKAKALLDSGLDFLSFSFDGYDKETYESIRLGATFETTLSNIIRFLELKKKGGYRLPYTVLTVIEFSSLKERYRQSKADFLRRFKGLPLDALRVRAPHNWGGGYDNGEIEARRRQTGFIPCTFLWYALTIFWDGTVVPCPQDFFGKLSLGNLNDQTLWDIWNSERMVYLRRSMTKEGHKSISPCNTCDRLWRKSFVGVPVDGIVPFLKDNILGYRVLKGL